MAGLLSCIFNLVLHHMRLSAIYGCEIQICDVDIIGFLILVLLNATHRK